MDGEQDCKKASSDNLEDPQSIEELGVKIPQPDQELSELQKTPDKSEAKDDSKKVSNGNRVEPQSTAQHDLKTPQTSANLNQGESEFQENMESFSVIAEEPAKSEAKDDSKKVSGDQEETNSTKQRELETPQLDSNLKQELSERQEINLDIEKPEKSEDKNANKEDDNRKESQLDLKTLQSDFNGNQEESELQGNVESLNRNSKQSDKLENKVTKKKYDQDVPYVNPVPSSASPGLKFLVNFDSSDSSFEEYDHENADTSLKSPSQKIESKVADLKESDSSNIIDHSKNQPNATAEASSIPNPEGLVDSRLNPEAPEFFPSSSRSPPLD